MALFTQIFSGRCFPFFFHLMAKRRPSLRHISVPYSEHMCFYGVSQIAFLGRPSIEYKD
ncbi:hypothetical protein AMATHDRAFT_67453 [Amanita thiersii Skay4041]|uniref:Uncharacterized protein n=1 Tax=Amanita thiersii Skay4041 TaxID=703135 RepID=A0A2A9NC04_9AGAR|nr:hypothetical protein AMATHDRAFT_67453 [Amanita thiersii Skay4041]